VCVCVFFLSKFCNKIVHISTVHIDLTIVHVKEYRNYVFANYLVKAKETADKII
jgi:hypothetical protein